jgi:hypothetical protein
MDQKWSFDIKSVQGSLIGWHLFLDRYLEYFSPRKLGWGDKTVNLSIVELHHVHYPFQIKVMKAHSLSRNRTPEWSYIINSSFCRGGGQRYLQFPDWDFHSSNHISLVLWLICTCLSFTTRRRYAFHRSTKAAGVQVEWIISRFREHNVETVVNNCQDGFPNPKVQRDMYTDDIYYHLHISVKL